MCIRDSYIKGDIANAAHDETSDNELTYADLSVVRNRACRDGPTTCLLVDHLCVFCMTDI